MATKLALERYLDRLRLRSKLSTAECDAVRGLNGSIVTVAANQDFVRIGDTIDHACLIVDGLAARFAQIRNGNRGTVAFHIPGDMADLHSVVAPNVTWALHAATATTVLQIPHTELIAVAERHPAIAFAFWRDCVVDANVLAQWSVNVGRKDAAARVAHILCEMQVRYSVIGLADGSRFPFPITQTDLADALGLTPVHLNRVLKRFKDERIVTKDLGSIVVLNHAKLAAIGEFDSAYLELARNPAPKS